MADDAVDGHEAVRRMPQAAEDSGIDSDGSQVRRVRGQEDIELVPLNDFEVSDEPRVRLPARKWVLDSGSSEEDLVITSPKPRCPKNKYNEQVENTEDRNPDQELLIPMVGKWQQPQLDDSDSMLPESPDRSSSSIYEVELTASDEDDDGSVVELVIPLHSAARNRLLNPKTPKFCRMFYICCCYPVFFE